MIRTENSLQGLTGIEAWDGKDGWSLDPFGGRHDPQRTPPDDAKSLAQAADLDGPLAKDKSGKTIFEIRHKAKGSSMEDAVENGLENVVKTLEAGK